MAGEWQVTTLGNCVKFISGGTPSKADATLWGGSIPWFSAKDMKSFWVDDSEDLLTNEGGKAATSLVPAGSTLLLVRGMTLHNDIPIVRVRRPSTYNQDVKGVLPREGVLADFVPYLLLGNKSALREKVDAAGHGTGRLALDALLALPVHLPRPSEQQAISNLLSALDDKIELNRRMAETLEAMARALFKSWFVDFDPVHAKAEGRPTGLSDDLSVLFPNGLDEAELPDGWRSAAIVEAFDLCGGGTPKTSIAEYWDGNIPWFSVVDAPIEPIPFVLTTERTITEAGLQNCASPLLPVGATIISARGTVGKLAIVGTPMAINQSCYAAVPRAGYSNYFTFFLLKNAIEDLKTKSHGSVFSTITRQTFDSVNAPLPPPVAAAAYDRVASPWMNKIKILLQQSSILADLRDTLLPKLISGELRIADAEKRIAAA